MRIGVDLDGTICEIRHDTKTYKDVKPLPGAVEKLQQLHRNGHKIVIITARHMKSCDGDSSKVIAKVGKITLDWLEKYQIPIFILTTGACDLSRGIRYPRKFLMRTQRKNNST